MTVISPLSVVSGTVLVTILAGILIAILVLLSNETRDRNLPQAIDGQIDLSHQSLENEYSVPLAGKWQFYWEQLLTNEQLSGIPSETISVPNAWLGHDLKGKKLPSKGYATYVVDIKLDKQYPLLSVKIPSMGTAFRMFIDDQLLASAGQVSSKSDTSQASFQPDIHTFEPPSRQFKMIVQVSNHEFYWGGMWHAIRLGEPATIHKEQYREILKTTYIVAIFFTICAFNLIQFSLRPKNPLPMIIALTCAMLAFREIESSHILAYTQLYYLGFDASVRINFLTFYAATAPMSLYFYLNFSQQYHKAVMWIIGLVSGGLSLYVCFASVDAFSSTMPFFQVFVIFVMIYNMYVLVKAVLANRSNAWMLFIGSVVLFALMLNDILNSLRIINSVSLVSFGLVAFVMCQNYLTYKHFINASDENKHLNKTLEQRNAELEQFSQSLEQQVNSRTQELDNANTKLEALANLDALTELPNRRGLIVHLDKAKATQGRSGQDFCLVLIDFDHFKQLNDTFGHDLGDLALKDGAAIMRNAIRAQDTIGRWGGEEFVLLVPDTNIDGAETVAEKLRIAIQQELSPIINTQISVTIGIAQCATDESIDACLKRADDALYMGKSKGRNISVRA